MGFIKITIICALLLVAFVSGIYIGAVTLPSWQASTESSELLAGLAGFAVQTPEKKLPHIYSWTTALCGTDGRCMDMFVTCNGTQILNITPVSPLLAHDEFWQDPRGGNPEQLCIE